MVAVRGSSLRREWSFAVAYAGHGTALCASAAARAAVGPTAVNVGVGLMGARRLRDLPAAASQWCMDYRRYTL